MEREKIKEFVSTISLEKPPFEPGKTHIACSGKLYDHEELVNGVSAVLEGWWTEGEWTKRFDDDFKNKLGVKNAMLVNSGSSANLIAVSSLFDAKIGENVMKQGDEVITVAAGFPTTVNPIIQNGAVPVFVDVYEDSYNVNVDELEKAISEKTKAIMLAHTLGNPFNLKEVMRIKEEHNLWLVEDCCDALGSKYDGKYVSTFGDIATFSFYPAHQITMGEGGAIVTNNSRLFRVLKSIRDWGRDCWCHTGQSNACGKRFDWQLGELPLGFDHKYTYSSTGYNLKATDLQAAIGVAQLAKLDIFVQKRRENFEHITAKLKDLKDIFILPKATEGSEPCWFGYLLTIRDNRINRRDLLQHLNSKNIETRMLFGGNITKQPYFKNIKYRNVSELKNTDKIKNSTFWIGVEPSLRKEEMDYVVAMIKEFLR